MRYTPEPKFDLYEIVGLRDNPEKNGKITEIKIRQNESQWKYKVKFQKEEAAFYEECELVRISKSVIPKY